MPLDYLACYEMPQAIVSSEPRSLRPRRCSALGHGRRTGSPTAWRRGSRRAVVGLIGVIRRPILPIASAPGSAPSPRPIARTWRYGKVPHAPYQTAGSAQGLPSCRLLRALAGTHPAQNLAGIAPNSVFIIGRRDPFVPASVLEGLLQAIATQCPARPGRHPGRGTFQDAHAERRYKGKCLAYPREAADGGREDRPPIRDVSPLVLFRRLASTYRSTRSQIEE